MRKLSVLLICVPLLACNVTESSSPDAQSIPMSDAETSAAPQDNTGALPTESAMAKPDTAPEVAAENIMRTWGRPTVPAKQWADELRPLLTRDAAGKYLHADPMNIPVHTVRVGQSKCVLPTQSEAHCNVLTNAGGFGVHMVLHGTDWKMLRLIFPEISGH